MTPTNPWGHRGPGTVEVALTLDVPVRTAYDRWSQFASFPRFMRRVRRADQVRPAVTRWFVRLGPLHHEFYAEVREQHPDTLISWRSLGHRLRHEGEVSFRPLGESRSALRLTMRPPCPAGVPPGVVAAVLRPLVAAELERFKTFVESVGDVGESWRGTIRDGRVENIENQPPAFPGWVHG